MKKKPVTKKTTSKKSTTKKAPAKKAPAKKSRVKKTTAKRTTRSTTTKPAPPNALHEAPPLPVALTDDQLRKVKTGLKKKDLDFFRAELLERRAEIIGDLKGMESARSESSGDISHVPLHMADVGSDNYDREFTLSLMESERKLLLEIDEALQRIEAKTYGVCAETGQPIERPRLEYMPWAKYCLDVARERERRGL
ncbi:MAG: TraR/DksA C4-type zinc finger protein [Planctomycetota bacterium]